MPAVLVLRNFLEITSENLFESEYLVVVGITFHISSSFSSVSRSRNIAPSLGLVHSEVISSVVGFLGQLNR